jgi:hypothetical protein
VEELLLSAVECTWDRWSEMHTAKLFVAEFIASEVGIAVVKLKMCK